MSKSGNKRLLWVSIVLLLLSIFGAVIGGTIENYKIGDKILYISVELLVLSVSAIIALISLRFENNRWFRKIVILLTILLPVCLFIHLAPASWINVTSSLGITLVVTGILVSITATIVLVFILSKPDSIGGLLIILSFVVLTLVLKQIYKVADTETIAYGFLMFGPGMTVFGIRSLFIIRKNAYLKTLTFLTCLLIFFVSWEIIWLTPDSNKTILIIYTILIFIVTFLVLLSLPFSGYILWSQEHKRILKKLMIPWIFILLIVSIRFIFPDLNKLFFREKPNVYQEFNMQDYQILNKNGLEPE